MTFGRIDAAGPGAAPWRDVFGLEGFPHTLAVAGRTTPAQHLAEMQAFVAHTQARLDEQHDRLLMHVHPERHPDRTEAFEALSSAYDRGGRELEMLARHLARLLAQRRRRVRAGVEVGVGCRPDARGSAAITAFTRADGL